MTSKQLFILEQMLLWIESYRTGDIGLHSLVSNLSSYYEAIDNQDDAWKQSVWGQIGDLELVNAWMLSRDITEIDENGRKIVDQVIKEVVGLLEKAKSKDSII